MPTREELIYAAGLFDGEGSMSIAVQRKGVTRPSHRPVCSVGMTNRALIEWLRDTFGGHVYHAKPLRPHWEPASHWRLSGKEALAFITSVRPYLRGKAAQADVVLEFRHLTCTTRTLSDELITAREALRRRVQSFNAKRGLFRELEGVCSH